MGSAAVEGTFPGDDGRIHMRAGASRPQPGAFCDEILPPGSRMKTERENRGQTTIFFAWRAWGHEWAGKWWSVPGFPTRSRDRKSTRLNSSHLVISYAVFC